MNAGTPRRPAESPPDPTPMDSAEPQPEEPARADAAVTPHPAAARVSAASVPQPVGSADRPARPVASCITPRPERRQVTPPPPLPKSVTQLLPPSGFLHDYVEDAYPLTEAPAEAHLIAALVTASALVGRKVRIAEWGHSSLYLNLWAGHRWPEYARAQIHGGRDSGADHPRCRSRAPPAGRHQRGGAD